MEQEITHYFRGKLHVAQNNCLKYEQFTSGHIGHTKMYYYTELI
jgi:hypothetical protein